MLNSCQNNFSSKIFLFLHILLTLRTLFSNFHWYSTFTLRMKLYIWRYVEYFVQEQYSNSTNILGKEKKCRSSWKKIKKSVWVWCAIANVVLRSKTLSRYIFLKRLRLLCYLYIKQFSHCNPKNSHNSLRFFFGKCFF